MEVRALFGRFVWRGVNIDDVTIHPSREVDDEMDDDFAHLT